MSSSSRRWLRIVQCKSNLGTFQRFALRSRNGLVGTVGLGFRPEGRLTLPWNYFPLARDPPEGILPPVKPHEAIRSTSRGKCVSVVGCSQLPMRSTRIITGLVFVAAGAYALGLTALLLWLSGDWRWVEGWIFGVWWVSFMAAILLWLHYKDPALLAERMRMPGSGGESHADMAILIGVKAGFIAWIFLSPLDVRFGWLPRLPLWGEVCGCILLLGGSFFAFRALADNTFASPLVRIQTERGQHVIDTGAYGFVRHPMYLGASLVFVGGALLLGSLCGLLVGLAMVGLLILRIFGEEKLLARDLEGYKEYLQKVRYRLVPHVW